MKWKQKKSRSRIHAQQRKKNRGRASGAATKETKPQLQMIDQGYANIHHLLYDLVRKENA